MSIYKKFEQDTDSYTLTEQERVLARLEGITEQYYRTRKLIRRVIDNRTCVTEDHVARTEDHVARTEDHVARTEDHRVDKSEIHFYDKLRMEM